MQLPQTDRFPCLQHARILRYTFCVLYRPCLERDLHAAVPLFPDAHKLLYHLLGGVARTPSAPSYMHSASVMTYSIRAPKKIFMSYFNGNLKHWQPRSRESPAAQTILLTKGNMSAGSPPQSAPRRPRPCSTRDFPGRSFFVLPILWQPSPDTISGTMR